MRVSAMLAATLAAMPALAQDTTVIRAGLVIDRNITLRPGAYRIQSANVGAPVLTIRGSNIDLDLSGVELIGSPDSARPDQYAGLAIVIDGGEHASIRNARIRGFKVGILARNVRDLRLQGNDVSRNWKQRLPEGLMARRFASINDAPIREDERRILAPGDQALPARPNR